ncbi:MAG: hypothetical protein H0U98_04730 [Alphaproteobacteria bacterium]|nr:hypothetical protein [Alphaproteobacteria bacterium]
MPRYFFHIREGESLSRDTEGQELADGAAARREAVSTGRELLGEKLLHGGELDGRIIEIANEKGEVLDRVSSNDVLFKDGKFRIYADDITQSAPVNTPRE